LRGWLEAYGTGKKTAADGTLTSSPLRSSTGRSSTVPARATGPADETPEQKIARLEAENAALRAETTKLATEREILQKAAKYFAGETRW
jgi:transposase